jgi:hypothetical protein
MSVSPAIWLFEAQRHNRIEVGGAMGWIQAK